MVQTALLVLLLVLSTAHAQDDDGVLDTSPMGEGIPERIEQLEREWAEDVGVKAPVDEPEADAPEPSDPAHDDEPEPVKAPPVDEPRPGPALRKPGDEARDAGRRPSDGAAAKKTSPAASREERRAISED